jgi:hypothetical protein
LSSQFKVPIHDRVVMDDIDALLRGLCQMKAEERSNSWKIDELEV